MAMDGLSENAIRLLTTLRAQHADSPQRAVKDRDLAQLTGLHERLIIRSARELLEHGYLVLATCAAPWGRFVTDDVAMAIQHLRSLDHRAKCVLVRHKLLAQAIERHRPGQLALFSSTGGAGVAPAAAARRGAFQ